MDLPILEYMLNPEVIFVVVVVFFFRLRTTLLPTAYEIRLALARGYWMNADACLFVFLPIFALNSPRRMFLFSAQGMDGGMNEWLPTRQNAMLLLLVFPVPSRRSSNPCRSFCYSLVQYAFHVNVPGWGRRKSGSTAKLSMLVVVLAASLVTAVTAIEKEAKFRKHPNFKYKTTVHKPK